jgi:hypothetical protein
MNLEILELSKDRNFATAYFGIGNIVKPVTLKIASTSLLKSDLF